MTDRLKSWAVLAMLLLAMFLALLVALEWLGHTHMMSAVGAWANLLGGAIMYALARFCMKIGW